MVRDRHDDDASNDLIATSETCHPGAVFAIWGGDCSGRWIRLWQSSGETTFMGHKPRAFSPQLATCHFPIQMIRVILCHESLPGHCEIDAVALLGSTSPLPEVTDLQRRLSDLEGKSFKLIDQVRALGLDVIGPEVPLCDLKAIGQDLLRQPIEDTDNGCFDQLPKEVIFHVFSYLDLMSLARCCQVSKLFAQLACDSQLYTVISLKPFFHLASDRLLSSLSSRCNHLAQLDLSWCGNYGKIKPKVLKSFFQTCGQPLTHLRLNNCHSCDAGVVQEISSTCSNLIELSLSNCHLLDSSHFDPLTQLHQLRHVNLYRTKIGHRQVTDIIRSNPRYDRVTGWTTNQLLFSV